MAAIYLQALFLSLQFESKKSSIFPNIFCTNLIRDTVVALPSFTLHAVVRTRLCLEVACVPARLFLETPYAASSGPQPVAIHWRCARLVTVLRGTDCNTAETTWLHPIAVPATIAIHRRKTSGPSYHRLSCHLPSYVHWIDVDRRTVSAIRL